jgi:2-polyprenyl-3-methyl-5-hydroxy-6-metoxy-1,4-benzoquinol methylase
MNVARYDAVVETYAPTDDELSRPVAGDLLDLAAVQPGEMALDLACGDGLVAREMARRGANVTGLDLSRALVDRARLLEVKTPLGIIYVHADAAVTDFVDASFDLITCHFGLSDIDDLDGTVTNVSRWLKPGGRFVFSILHPCFGGGDGADPSWPPWSTYHDERWWRARGEASTLRRAVGSNHRTLSTYANQLVANGLSIEMMREPVAEQSWMEMRPSAARQPVYLVVRCRRI